jgi:hypothetical protein
MMPKESRNLLRQIGVVVAVIATILVSILADTGGAQFDVLFLPAFSVCLTIWAAIYAGLLAYAIYQARPALRHDLRLRSLDLPILLSSATNIAWQLLWHFQHTMAAVLVSLVMLGSLITIYRRLDSERPTASAGRRWAVHHPFSAYLGWMTIGVMVNIGIMLDVLGWTGFGLGETTWFALGLLALLSVAGIMTWLRADVVYLLTLMGALVGIGIERAANPSVSALVWTATGVLAVMAVSSAASGYRQGAGEHLQ